MLPLKKTDVLLLACTHYQAAQEAFKKLAPHAQIINPAFETIKWVEKNWSFAKKPSADIFYTTGNTLEMKTSSFKAFAVKIEEVKVVHI
jgi:glutamate racemase